VTHPADIKKWERFFHRSPRDPRDTPGTAPVAAGPLRQHHAGEYREDPPEHPCTCSFFPEQGEHGIRIHCEGPLQELSQEVSPAGATRSVLV
jgi:hypothetical protein